MKPFLLACLFWTWIPAGSPATAMDFSGTWKLNPLKSSNLGMMASMRLIETVRQTPNMLSMLDTGTMNGQTSTSEFHYDLTGKPSTNEDFMGVKNETVSQWVGAKLVTTWTAEGAVAGTKTIRTETRSLAGNGKTMTVESVRGEAQAIIMVFDKR